MIIDFHSHLLPGIDDGASDTDISKMILAKEIADNVDIIVATPHYYCEERSIQSFVTRRNNSLSWLLASINPTAQIPKIVLGAEVYFSHFLTHMDNIKDLCIQGTNYLLLELAYRKITPAIIEEILDFSDKNDVNIILAHVERYLNYTTYKSLLPLLDSGVLCQVNCDSIVNPASRKKVFKLINKGYVYAIGTDVHNCDTRPALMKESLAVLEKKFKSNYIDSLMYTSSRILANEDIENILRQ